MFMAGWSFEQREARRALYAEAVRLRGEGCGRKQMAALLGLSAGRLGALLSDPPFSEADLQRRNEINARARKDAAEWAARRRKRDRELRARWRSEAMQQRRDEEREAKANAFVCLIEALEEMRPYVGTEGV